MNTSEIEILIEKFYEGNTTIQEEKILGEFFGAQDVPAHLQQHQSLFAGLRHESLLEISNPLFEKGITGKLVDNQFDTASARRVSMKSRLVFLTGIAASILLVAGLFFALQQDVIKQSFKQTGKAGSLLAYADASQALMLVSCNLNTGLKQVERLQMMDKAMKNIELFNKFYQCETIIINPDEISNKSIKSN
ncbi:MAG: hypothetical protein ACOYNC_06940 [Bacteroidales bacterium]